MLAAAESITVHIPTAILGPLLVAAIAGGAGSYVWLLKTVTKLSGNVKEIQSTQDKIIDKIGL